MPQKLLSLSDTAKLLGMSQEEVEGLVQKGHIETYRIGGAYLRFKQDQVEDLKKRLQKVNPETERAGKWKMPDDTAADDPSLSDKLKDFWYFNNFYIISTAIIVTLVILILR